MVVCACILYGSPLRRIGTCRKHSFCFARHGLCSLNRPPKVHRILRTQTPLFCLEALPCSAQICASCCPYSVWLRRGHRSLVHRMQEGKAFLCVPMQFSSLRVCPSANHLIPTCSRSTCIPSSSSAPLIVITLSDISICFSEGMP